MQKFKKCRKCLEEKSLSEFQKNMATRDNLHYYCGKCANGMSDKYRASHRDVMNNAVKRWLSTEKGKKYSRERGRYYYKLWPEKIKARSKVYHAVKNGLLKKDPCITCGSVKSQAHHEDYSKPLDVIWACALHHRELDRKLHGQI